MKARKGSFMLAGPALPALALCTGAAAGPVILSGDAADSHTTPGAYIGLLQHVIANTTNGQTGILALGVDVGSPAAAWIVGVSASLPQPQALTFVNDETILAITLSGYAAIYVPSDSGTTPGGISATENGYLAMRADDIAQFLNAGGGLIGLTQGTLEDPYAYLGTYGPVQSSSVPGGGCAPEQPYDNVSATPTGALLGVDDAGLDGCCWRGVFESFPPVLVALARANEPGCAGIDGKAALLGGFVEIGFDDPTVFDAAGAARTETLADVNGDGERDVIVTIPNPTPTLPGSIQVFLNQGTDELGAWQGLVANPPITVGIDPTAVAGGLLDADPHVDLAVTNAGDNTVSVLINDGSGGGTFLPAAVVPVGQHPVAIVARDFNRDTFIDLAVANALDEDFMILLNDGDGNFGSPVVAPPPMGLALSSMSVGDFDNSKDPDLVGGGNSTAVAGGPTAGFVFVALGNGDGTFAAPVLYSVGSDPRDVAVADVDGDGLSDIASANNGDGTISLLMNVGGSFAAAIPIPVGDAPTSVDAADFDGDSDPDLAVVAVDPEAGPAVQVLVNASGAAAGLVFQSPLAFTVNATPQWVVTGFLNNDGLPDVATSNADGPTVGSVAVLLNAPSTLKVPESLVAHFDIRTNACPNPLNPGSNGVLPTALVGSDSFEVEEVRLDTLRLSRADGVGGAVPPIGADGDDDDDDPIDAIHAGGGGNGPQFHDITAPFPGEPCDCDVLVADGILDIKLKFGTEELAEELELEDLPGGSLVELVLSGELLDGTAFAASDCVLLVPPKTAPGLLSVSSTAPGAFIDATPADQQLDDGGFAPFQRKFSSGTAVTLSAPTYYQGRVLLGWTVLGSGPAARSIASFIPGDTLRVTVWGQNVAVQAVYLELGLD